MKKVVALLLALLMVFALVACSNGTTDPTQSGSSSAPTQAPTSTEPTTPPATTTGGELVIGQSSDLVFIPSWMIRAYNDRACGSLVYEALVKLDENSNWEPYLLESLTPDAEALTWTCVVRDGVTFSDGTPFDADALLWNFENYKANSNTSSTHFGAVNHFEKVDDKTVVIHLDTWTSQIPYSFQDNCGYMYSPKAFEENGADWCNTHAVGTGPYIEDEVVVGEYRTYVRNENYWNKDATISYDKITWKVIADESSAQAALLSGEIDGYFSPSQSMLSTMLAQDGFNYAMNTTTFGIYFMIPPSAIEGSGWEDVNVRKAAYYAINSQEIVDSVTYGMAFVSNQYAGEGTPFYNEELEGYPYDVEKAKECMAASNYPNGFKTKIYQSNQNLQMANGVGIAVQSYLAEIGIECEIVNLEPAIWLETFKNAQDGFMIGMHGFGMNLANQMKSNFAQSSADGVGMMCYSKLHPDDLDALINKAVQATDTDTMIQAVKDANKLLSDEYALAYPVFMQEAYGMLWSDGVVDSGCINNTSLSFDWTKVAPAA